MWQIAVTILYAVLSSNAVSCEDDQTTPEIKQCPYGDVVLDSRFRQVNNSCQNCSVCRISDDETEYEYIFCLSMTKLKDCHEAMFLQLWTSNIKNWDKVGPLNHHRENGKKPSGIEVPAVQTTSKTTSLVPDGHIPFSLAVCILIAVPTAGLLIAITCFVLLRKKKKEMFSIYDAAISRRRPREVEDENYIRYTKDPTSLVTRQKEQVRASWPRSASRSENRYLLEVASRAPVSDTGDTATNETGDNQDSNSAHYVFIQTFLPSPVPASEA